MTKALYSLFFSFVLFGNLNSAIANTTAVEGDVEKVVSDNFKTGQSETHFHVRDTKSGRMLRLKLKPEHLSSIQTGQKIRVQGTKKASELQVESIDLAMDGSSSRSNFSPTVATGARSVVALLVTFTDAAPFTTAARVNSYLFGASNSVDQLYRANTQGRLSLIGDLDKKGSNDVYSVSINYAAAASCDYASWANAADAAAKAQGVNLLAHQHIMYVLPSQTNCGWLGLGDAPGTRTWIRDGDLTTFAHELGHNLGFDHAATDLNNDGIQESEYGDHSSFMGNGLPSFMNSANYVMMGLQAGSTGANLVDGYTGKFTLAALEADSSTTSHPQIIRLPKINTGDNYFLSYRRRLSYDSQLPSTYISGVSIHKLNNTYNGKTYYIATVAPGFTWCDPANKTEISVPAQPLSDTSLAINLNTSSSCTVAGSATLPSASPTPVPTPTPSARAIVIDNKDSQASRSGSWCTSSAKGFYGTGSVYSCGSGLDTFTWTPSVSVSQYYDVYLWYPAKVSRTKTAPFLVRHADGDTTKYFNQRSAAQWILHGRYRFTKGSQSQFVRVTNQNGQVSADAVKFVPASN